MGFFIPLQLFREVMTAGDGSFHLREDKGVGVLASKDLGYQPKILLQVLSDLSIFHIAESTGRRGT